MDTQYFVIIQEIAESTVLYLLLISLFGVGIHILLSNWLVFFNFKAGETGSVRKGWVRRLLIPLFIVMGFSALMPWINVIRIVRQVNDKDILKNPDITNFVERGCKYFVPIAGYEWSVGTCFFLGIVFYFIIGSIVWLISKAVCRKC